MSDGLAPASASALAIARPSHPFFPNHLRLLQHQRYCIFLRCTGDGWAMSGAEGVRVTDLGQRAERFLFEWVFGHHRQD
jgi:hypothetical protein